MVSVLSLKPTRTIVSLSGEVCGTSTEIPDFDLKCVVTFEGAFGDTEVVFEFGDVVIIIV